MTETLNAYALGSGLFGGLAVFLLGMDIITQALKQVAGDHMKAMLARMTRNRFVGLVTGAVSTAIIQSSSVTTVLLVGFISAGLMSTAQGAAIVIGANIGSTITAQILAFKVSALALPLVALGFFTSLVWPRESVRQYGLMLLGLGLVFFGMAIMSETMTPLRSYQPFLNLMVSLNNPLFGALVGAVFTAIIQSSAATTGILIVMAGQGLLSLDAAIALALGANIGTCATAGLAAIGKPREAVRIAVVHVLFNVLGVLIWIGFVDQLAQVARLLSPAYPGLTGAARVAAEVPRQIANVHTFFNVINAALFIGFTTQLTRFVEWLVPDKPLTRDELAVPRYLNDQLLSTPAIALDAARREIVRLGGLVANALQEAMAVVLSGKRSELKRLAAMDKPIDGLHREIVGYLRQLSLQSLSAGHSDQLVGLLKIANDLEHIGDQIARDITGSTAKRLDENVEISKATARALTRLHEKVLHALQEALAAIDSEDVSRAAAVRAMKQDLVQAIEELARHEVARLRADEPRRLVTYAREIELVEIFNDIFKTTRRIARTQIEVYGPPADRPTAEAPEAA